MRRSTACVLVLLLAAATTSAAEVYRWTDRNGVVHYSDSPPNPDARPARLPPIQTFHGDPGADPFAGAPAPPSSAAAAAAVVPPRILAPADGTTDRDANGHLLVRVKADLAPGEGLLYEVDGQPQNHPPTLAMQMDLAGLERGTHQITVALTAADGHVLARSTPVTIYMKPPIVRQNRPPLARPR